MIQLRTHTHESQVDVHTGRQVRVYLEDGLQRSRIELAREVLKRIIGQLSESDDAHRPKHIVELGCGACDITGFFSWGHKVEAYECSLSGVAYVKQNWKWVDLRPMDFVKAEPVACDVLVACEVLEHLADPLALLAKWLPLAKYALISSPLKGDREGDLSGGEHVWSFDEDDFEQFAGSGGHQIVGREQLPMGGYLIQFIATKRRDSTT